MPNGLERFDFYLDQIEKLMTTASQEKDPGMWLYQNNARTSIFMIEGLAKLYGGLHNKKRFGEIEAHFKLLEDSLGAIDYYDGFAKQFSGDKTVSSRITKFAASKSVEKAAMLNVSLLKKGWVGTGADRILKIRKKLRGADWLDYKPEIRAIELFYRASIKKIDTFAEIYQKGFTELETQVHELRRKLRWLSIYPQALRGRIQLTKNAADDKKVKKYLTPEIVNSPFNKMPSAGANRYVLLLNRDYFFALSWMISELGKLKDQGLRLVLLEEAGNKAGPGLADETQILANATDICRVYFAEKNLDKLISSVIKNRPSLRQRMSI